MKRSFTTFSGPFQKEAKSAGITLDVMLDEFSKHTKRTLDPHDYGMLMCMQVEYSVHQNQALHIFVPNKDFCDWLVSCVPEFEPNHAKIVQEHIGKTRVGVLHFPTDARLHSAAFYIPRDGVDPLTLLDAPQYGCIFMCFSRPSSVATASIMLCNSGIRLGELSDVTKYYGKLIIGLGMYFAAFPEAAKDGPPSELKHPSMHSYEHAQTILVSPKIQTVGTHGSPSAHFRRGHFRMLRNECFKNKRFSAVFVRETFVNGKCVTALTPDEVDAISSK